MIIEILVKAVDISNPDLIADKVCWKSGYPVVVKEKGWPWGKCECLPDFVIIRITDARDLGDVVPYSKPIMADVTREYSVFSAEKGMMETKAVTDKEVVHRSKYVFNKATMEKAVAEKGVLEMTLAEMQEAIEETK